LSLQQGYYFVPVTCLPRRVLLTGPVDRDQRYGLRRDTGLARRQGSDEVSQRLPALHPLCARHEALRIRERDVVVRTLRLLSPAEIEAHVAPHPIPRAHVTEVIPDDPHG